MKTDTNSWRLFVAIQVPDAVKGQLVAIQKSVRFGVPGVAASWTKPESMHLTLRFLGRVCSSRVDALADALKSAVAGFGAFPVACERLGCFPGIRSPRVVWAGVQDSSERLAVLQKRVESGVGMFSEEPREARFVGHITLARIRRISRPSAERFARIVGEQAGGRYGEWTVNRVSLVRSELGPAGAHYTEYAAAPLGVG